MASPLLRRLLLALLPTILIVSAGISTIWGDNGLLASQRLAEELVEANAQLAAIERENQRMLRELQHMEDPVILERMVAEELGWGRPEATIIRFERQEPDATTW